jgi:serine protease Do
MATRGLASGTVLGSALLWCAAVAAAGETLADVFDRVHRSVVVIRTTEMDVPEDGDGLAKVAGVGSGVLISTDGKVLTADHLVHAASEIYAEFPGGDRVRARVLAVVRSADLALLQLVRVPADAVVARVADSERARIGDRVFVVGAPHGYGHTLTVGHLSARRRGAEDFPQAEFLQTDAAINRGNSGGPMFSMAGEVLGIVSHLVSTSDGSEGLGFVVSANTARELLLERQTAWLGVDGAPLRGDLLRIFNLREPGVLVQRVVEGSAAAALGLRGGMAKATIAGRTLIVGGDVLLRIQGVPVAAGGQAREALAALKPGEILTVTIVRAGEILTLSTPWVPRE